MRKMNISLPVYMYPNIWKIEIGSLILELDGSNELPKYVIVGSKL